MGNPFEDLRQAVVVRPMNSPGPQGAEAPEMKIQYSNDGSSWHNDPVDTDRYLRFSTDNGMSWSSAIYFNNLAETLEWVEKAKQWATNPENDPVEDLQYSALHHALQAKKSEITAGEYAVEAGKLITGAYGIAPPSWDSATVYNYGDIVSFDNGQVYRCIGTNIVGATHAPNINGIDNKEDWTRITAVLDGYFEVDENGDFMPMIAPTNSEIFMLDENSDITYQDPIELDASRATIELFTLDENGDIAYRDPTDHRPGGGNIELYKEMEFVDSIADFRTSRFYGTTKYVYVLGYYGKGTPGGGMFYKDIESQEDDNSGTIIIDGDGIRWKRANVGREYYANWFGVSTHLADNSPLIQNALNNMHSGDILIFDSGRFNCKQTIKLPYLTPSYENNVGITIQGAGKGPSHTRGSTLTQTYFRYTGPSQPVLTPFFDFRCAHRDVYQIFNGSIRNICIYGGGRDKNMVGLWLHRCEGALIESVAFLECAYGMRIEKYCFWAKFNDILTASCGCGVQANGGNGAVFNYCNFRACDIGFKGGGCIAINDSYFEAIYKVSIEQTGTLYVNHCWFETTFEYMIHVTSTGSPLLVLSNSVFGFDAQNLSSNKAPIKQSLAPGGVLTLVLKNNIISNGLDIYYGPNDYLVYVESGDIIIQAENNKVSPYPDLCLVSSKEPLEVSHFNSDFSFDFS